MLNNQENYSKFEVEQAKRDIKSLVKEKSKFVKLDFSKQEDIDKFFGDENFRNMKEWIGKTRWLFNIDFESWFCRVIKRYSWFIQ